MSGTTVRVTPQTRETLAVLADETGHTLQEVIAEAVEMYRRRRILEQTAKVYAAMRADPAAWKAEQEERAEWDVTLGDGLDEEY